MSVEESEMLNQPFNVDEIKIAVSKLNPLSMEGEDDICRPLMIKNKDKLSSELEPVLSF